MSKNSIKNLFDELLREKRGFKYVLSTKIILKKRINDNEHKYSTVYFNSLVKTVINQRYHLKESFEDILSLLDIWINESSAWKIDQIDGIYINTSNYEPLSGSSYIPIPKKLGNHMKGLINLKNKDYKCFMWCHGLINPTNSPPERQDKKIAANLNYSDIEFPLNIRDYELNENRFEMNMNVFGYENKVYPLYISKKSQTQTLNLLLITQENKSHYVLLKDWNRLMYSKTKDQHKKHHCMSCLQSFTKEEILNQHKKQCLLINGCQAVNYESGTIKFTNHNKQIPILFKIYADTECFLKRVNSYEGEHTIKYQEHIPNSIGAKLVCIDDRFTLPSIIFKGKNCNRFITWVLDKQKWTKQITEQFFNKKLIMTNEDEEIYTHMLDMQARIKHR